MSREEMIVELQKCGYVNIRVKGGTVPLEEAPNANVYWMYKRVTGLKKGTVTIGKS